MITKGIIKSIDYNNNTCIIRIPLFENAAQKDEVYATATFAIQPGFINSYNENDVVIISFEENRINSPIILGKLYLGIDKEASEVRGSLHCDSITATKATLPINTKLTCNGGDKTLVNVQNGISTYKTIADIISALHTTEETFKKTNIDLDSQIHTIETTYLSTTKSPDSFIPTAEDEAWSTSIPT
jgi:hypothetical protein